MIFNQKYFLIKMKLFYVRDKGALAFKDYLLLQDILYPSQLRNAQ